MVSRCHRGRTRRFAPVTVAACGVSGRRGLIMNRAWKLLCLVVLSLFCSIAAFSQGAATAELHVTVKDSNGAYIRDANVSVSDPARSYERSTTTNVEGEYHFLLLPPGTYTVTVQAPNFAKTIAQNVN